jgi:tRNA(Ile)-lysidine synthase
MSFSPDELLGRVKRLPPAQALAIGFSGGLDSHVLLHACASLQDQLPPLRAIHVHHGLQDEADTWSVHCQTICDALNVPLTILAVSVARDKGEGLEAAARKARYAAIQENLGEGESLLTAHHQDDQAETLLLQLFRGAGPAGLASMPVWQPFATAWHGRPLLDFRRAELESWATKQELSWVDDPSNQDLRFTRNYLRHEAMPVLEANWPQLVETLNHNAALQAEALTLNHHLARLDEEHCSGEEPGTLSAQALMQIPLIRRKNLLRYWLDGKGLALPGKRHYPELLKLIEARSDAEGLVCWEGVEVRRYRDELYAFAPLVVHDPATEIVWPWGEDIHNPADGSRLKWQSLLDSGVLFAKPGQNLTLRFRQGGERIRRPGDEHHRKLKHLLQEANVPPWERDRIPIVYQGDLLLAVMGYWINQE